jgi:hypothetical protein
MPPSLKRKAAKRERRSSPLPMDVLEMLMTTLRWHMLAKLTNSRVREVTKLAVVNRALAKVVREHYEYWVTVWCNRVMLYDRPSNSPVSFGYRHLRLVCLCFDVLGSALTCSEVL